MHYLKGFIQVVRRVEEGGSGIAAAFGSFQKVRALIAEYGLDCRDFLFADGGIDEPDR
jgi:hypothetical protein